MQRDDDTGGVISTRLDQRETRLLDAIRIARGDPSRAATVRALVREEIERRMPGALAA